MFQVIIFRGKTITKCTNLLCKEVPLNSALLNHTNHPSDLPSTALAIKEYATGVRSIIPYLGIMAVHLRMGAPNPTTIA